MGTEKKRRQFVHPPRLNDAFISGRIREESNRSNKWLTFIQEQGKQDREYFKHLFQWAASVIVVLTAAAEILCFQSVAQLKNEMKGMAESEMQKTQAVLQSMRVSAQKSTSEMQYASQHELDNVRREVQKRVTDEFKSENITAIVARAAKERTNQELSPIIQSAVVIAARSDFHNVVAGPVCPGVLRPRRQQPR